MKYLLSVLLLVGSTLLAATPNALLDILANELDRNFRILKDKADPPAYFISYEVTDVDSHSISATLGDIASHNDSHSRALDVGLRVGTSKLDNYHLIGGAAPQFTASVNVPIEGGSSALKQLTWIETDRAYRSAAERLIKIKTSEQVKVAAQDKSDDFSPAPVANHVEPITHPPFANELWTARMRSVSAVFKSHPRILTSGVNVTTQTDERYFVNSEGTRLQHGRGYSRVMITATTRAEDGMNLGNSVIYDAVDPSRLPSEEVMKADAEKLARELEKLMNAPVAEPFVGPAIFSGKASGVFFHEIFGHRIEGHRQKNESEGQTFTKSVGELVLPTFLSVVFDPTVKQIAGIDLNGFFAYDDEGVAAQPVTAVDKGFLKSFLMSRTPIQGFSASNGHGRRQPGYEPVSRQSNLIVKSDKTVPEAELRQMLIAEVKKQNKPYGLLFQDITSGYTTTQRAGMQAFKVIPVVVYRIYADGRPDELIRGADMVGTPLASFNKILATSDRTEVFNGFCGAESGFVPVAVVSPAILVSEIEIEKMEKSQNRPPILPPPPHRNRSGPMKTLICLTLAAAPLLHAADDPALKAMRDELQRSMTLQFNSLEKPYYIEYIMEEGRRIQVTAVLDGVLSVDKSDFRVPRVHVRIGNPQFDNTNYVGSRTGFAGRYGVSFPLDNDYGALRHAFWLSTDQTYKSALEAISRKHAALKNVSVAEELPDFSAATQAKMVLDWKSGHLDPQPWVPKIKAVSSIFLRFPGLNASIVELSAIDGTRRLVTSEGGELRLPEQESELRMQTSSQAKDGMTVRDAVFFHCLGFDGLPSDDEMKRAAEELAANVTSLAAAPRAEDYSGPVLFEGNAASQILAELLGHNVALSRKPVTDPASGGGGGVAASELEGRIGSRILPESFSIVDDPTLKQWKGRRLFGTMLVDEEGVEAKPLTIVEKGVLKNFLLTRDPVRGFPSTNARARLEGGFGNSVAGITNLIVESNEAIAHAALKAKLIELMKQRNKPFGIMVRKMDFPSTGSNGEIRRLVNGAMRAGGSRPVSLPLRTYRVYPDGREEMVRGLRFRALSVRSLKDIVAAGDDINVFDYLENGQLFALVGAGTEMAETSVVAPSLLIDDLELVRIEDEQPNLPIVPAPELSLYPWGRPSVCVVCPAAQQSTFRAAAAIAQ